MTAAAPLLQTETPPSAIPWTLKWSANFRSEASGSSPFLLRSHPASFRPSRGSRDAAGGGFSANGFAPTDRTTFLLNGVDNNVNVIDFINQTAYVIGPSVEAIGEMRVVTNGYSAEYGRGAGGVVNVTIKSGTNDIHGTLFEFLQNDKLNANTWERNRAGATEALSSPEPVWCRHRRSAY